MKLSIQKKKKFLRNNWSGYFPPVTVLFLNPGKPASKMRGPAIYIEDLYLPRGATLHTLVSVYNSEP